MYELWYILYSVFMAVVIECRSRWYRLLVRCGLAALCLLVPCAAPAMQPDASGTLNVQNGGIGVKNDSIGPTQVDETASYTWSGTESFASGVLLPPSSTSPPSTDCDEAGEVGRFYVDTDAAQGSKCLICSGAGGWENCGAAGSGISGITADTGGTTTGSTVTAAGGAGITTTRSGDTVTFATASSETNFLAAGALTCGASTAGKMQVHTTPLQYCDNAGTPALQYAAYGNSSGESTAAANDSVALTTDTTGNYVASVVEGNYIDVTGTPAEGWTATVAMDPTEVNDVTWGDNTDTTQVWTFDRLGDDQTWGIGAATVAFSPVAAGQRYVLSIQSTNTTAGGILQIDPSTGGGPAWRVDVTGSTTSNFRIYENGAPDGVNLTLTDSGAFIWNDGADADLDFRVESVSDTQAIFVDSSANTARIFDNVFADSGGVTWGSATATSYTWTWDLSTGTDPALVFSSGQIQQTGGRIFEVAGGSSAQGEVRIKSLGTDEGGKVRVYPGSAGGDEYAFDVANYSTPGARIVNNTDGTVLFRWSDNGPLTFNPTSGATIDFIVNGDTVAGLLTVDVSEEEILLDGKVEFTGPAPTASSCGNSPSVNSTSTNMVGRVTTGTGSPSACTITFAQTWTTPPICLCQLQSGTQCYASASTTTTAVFTLASGCNSCLLQYHCFGWQ